jgi:GT2 family glycosyltransferase
VTESQPLVSIVIANWNGKDLLEECLDSIEKQTFSSFEMILIDNGSIDGSADWVEERYGRWVRVIRNAKNLGFAEANNIGIRIARGKYIVALNNDTVADAKWLEELIKPAETDSSVGMCFSKILSYSRPTIIDATGELLSRDGLNRARGQFEEDRGQYDSDVEIFYPPACGALYRKEMLDEIGLFDEDFFTYGEDTDLGLRGRWAGWRCIYVPQSVIYHKGSATTGRYSPFKAFYVERNRIWVIVKCFPLTYLLMSPFYTLLRYFFQSYGALTHRGAAGQFASKYSIFRLGWILLTAYGSAFKGLLRMWHKRKILNRIKRVDNQEFGKWLKRYNISAKKIALMN